MSRILLLCVLLLLALAASAFAAIRYFPYWPLYGYTGPLPAMTADEQALASRLRGHVTEVASVPHNTDHPAALEAAAQYIERQIEALGHRFERQEYAAAGQKVRNIHLSIGRSGSGKQTFVVGAHYDSWTIAPGANDNGTGTAALIELARLLKGHEPRRHLLRLVFFVNEERPHAATEAQGSYQFAQWIVPRESVRGMISLETMGAYYDQSGTQRFPAPLGIVYSDTGNFITFVGAPRARGLVHEALGAFRRHAQFPSIGGVAPGHIPGILWSDHASFDDLDVPAFMITDTALFRYPHYHKPTDTPDKIDYDRLARLTKGLERMLREIVD